MTLASSTPPGGYVIKRHVFNRITDLGGQLSLKLEHDADYSRDRFIVSGPNREAVQMMDRWPDHRSGAVALVGPAGVGKTHIASFWANRTGARALTSDDLRSERFADTQGCLVLDEADGAEHGEGFFHLLNWAARPGCALLLTGRSAPKTWSIKVADLRSRLNAVPVIEIGEPDDAVLRGVLLKLFQQRNIRPAADLLDYLALRMQRSLPAAQAIVTALDQAAAADHRAVSRSLARDVLKDDGED